MWLKTRHEVKGGQLLDLENFHLAYFKAAVTYLQAALLYLQCYILLRLTFG